MQKSSTGVHAQHGSAMTRRAEKRRELIAATAANLDKIKARVEAGRLRGAGKIGVTVGKIVGKHKMAAPFVLKIENAAFSYETDEAKIAAEAALDGIGACPGKGRGHSHGRRGKGNVGRNHCAQL